jgi:ABC-type spermidine/putrescine transport system permease subunit II
MKSSFLIAALLGISISFSQYILTLMLSDARFSTLMLQIIPYLKSGDINTAASYGIVIFINIPLALYGIYQVFRLKKCHI